MVFDSEPFTETPLLGFPVKLSHSVYYTFGVPTEKCLYF